MKGFAATPIIFIAVFLITVMLFLHFMDIDKQVAEGIGKEARLRKLQADMLKNQTAGATELYSCMLWAAEYSSDGTMLNSYMNDCLGRSGMEAHAFSNGFSANYTLDYKADTLIDADLNKTITVSERINYPFFELASAADNFAGEMNGKPCSSVTSTYNNYNGTACTGAWFTLNSANIRWCGMPTGITWSSCGTTCPMKYSVVGNNMTGYPLTTSTWHQVYREYTGLYCTY